MLWQSQRHEAYREALTWLGEQGLSYYCTCTRARIHAVGGIYDGHCRDLGLGAENAALRLRQTRPVLQFSDRLRGTLIANEPLAREDFIIHRRDGCSPTTWRWWSTTTFRGSPRLSAAQT